MPSAVRPVCVLGDSHVAALRRACPDRPDITFFAAQNELLREVELQGSCLSPRSVMLQNRLRAIAAPERLELDAFSRFVIVGAGLSYVPAMDVFRYFRLPGRGTDKRRYM